MEQKIIALDSIAKLSQRLHQYAYRGQQTTPVMEEIATDMIRIEEKVFSSDGRRGGGSWARLKPSTVKRKGNAVILRTKGARPGYSNPGMDALFLSMTRRGAPYQILHITRRGVEFGTDVPGAGVTQNTRPFLKFTQNDVDRWKQMIADYVVGVG